MPDYLDIFRTDVFPPIFKIFTRNIIRGRGDQVIEDDVVLLSPAEGAEMIQIIIVEELFSDRFRGGVGGR